MALDLAGQRSHVAHAGQGQEQRVGRWVLLLLRLLELPLYLRFLELGLMRLLLLLRDLMGALDYVLFGCAPELLDLGLGLAHLGLLWLLLCSRLLLCFPLWLLLCTPELQLL